MKFRSSVYFIAAVPPVILQSMFPCLHYIHYSYSHTTVISLSLSLFFVCLSVCLSVCLTMYPSLPVSLSLYLSLSLPLSPSPLTLIHCLTKCETKCPMYVKLSALHRSRRAQGIRIIQTIPSEGETEIKDIESWRSAHWRNVTATACIRNSAMNTLITMQRMSLSSDFRLSVE